MKNPFELEFYSYDLKQTITIGDFFKKLLIKLLYEQEEFNPKRPFGNSNWDQDLIRCLIQNELIMGSIDDDSCPINYRWTDVNKFVDQLIQNSTWK
jgi:hypothetical protein